MDDDLHDEIDGVLFELFCSLIGLVLIHWLR